MGRRRILLAWIPAETACELSSDAVEILFLDNKALRMIAQPGGQIQLLSDFSHADLNSSSMSGNPTTILRELERLEPLIRRWMSFEVLFGETIFSVFRNVEFFSKLLKDNRVERVIFSTGSPHHIDSMCLSLACQMNEIEQVFLYPTVFHGTLLPIKHAGFTKRSLRDWSGKKSVDGHSLIVDFVDALGKISEPNANLNPAGPFSHSSIVSLLRILLQGSRRALVGLLRPRPSEFPHFAGHNSLQLVGALVRHRRYLTRLKSMTTSDIISKACGKIVYFGHQEPESTCFPEGLPWKSQLEYLVALRHAFPTNEIYFKEHPASWRFFDKGNLNRLGLFRSRDFLDELANFGITPIGDISGLVNSPGCFVAATLVGTIAIEESLRGRKSLVGGTAWYQGLPGAMPFSTSGLEDEEILCNCHPAKGIESGAFEFLSSTLSNYGIPNSQGIGSAGLITRQARHAQDDFVSGVKKLVED